MTGPMRAATRALVLVIAFASISACSSESAIDSVGIDEAIAAGAAFVDDRPAVLDRLGAPDSFQISIDEIEGVMVRFESWSYHDLESRIDFVDGVVAWNIEIGGLSGDSLLPIWYAPLDFEMLMEFDEAQAIAADLSPANQTPTAIDLSEGGEDYEGIELMAGDQIILGFVDHFLVYVETLVLSPNDGGGS